MPDEIWVGDRKAKEIAQNFFPTLSIKLKKNPYFEDVKSQVKTVRSKIGNKKYTSILYVTEPISNWAIHNHGNEHYLGYTEKTALLFFMDNTHKMGFKNPIVRIKLHPSEPVGKYDEIIKKSKLNISVSKGKDLINEINKSDIVIGCNTMALVVALLLKKRVFCSIPVSGIPHPLPFSRIKYIRDLVNAS